MLSKFTGFNLEFRIKDITEDIDVFKDKCNIITEEEKQNYWNKFEKLLRRFIDDGDFLSYKKVKYLDEELWEYLKILKGLIGNGNREFAIELGQMIKIRLTSIGTDDDIFPEYEIDVIDDIIGLK